LTSPPLQTSVPPSAHLSKPSLPKRFPSSSQKKTSSFQPQHPPSHSTFSQKTASSFSVKNQHAFQSKIPPQTTTPSSHQQPQNSGLPVQSKNIAEAYECTTLTCLCIYVHGISLSTLGKQSIRKEYRRLTEDERMRFHNAVEEIRRSGEYDKIAQWHADPEKCGGAHSGPAFLPWHREYLKRFEFALRIVDPDVAIPYWDSTLEGQLQDGKDSCLFELELMGRFKRTVSNHSDEPQQGCHYKPTWTSLEYSNGNVILWLGGPTFQPSDSANNPLFFMHHAFLDKLWEDWRQRKQASFKHCFNKFHFANSLMKPFNRLKNIDGISDHYTTELYRYDSRPQCLSGADHECGSRYLFCDRSHGTPHCAAKVRHGGNCIGFENNENPCISGRCNDDSLPIFSGSFSKYALTFFFLNCKEVLLVSFTFNGRAIRVEIF
uniref:Tyrosinase_Cu-bd domain-containing protein n=1 Tax=Enterobius vermicularis TaxID=51028 RepID=A0A0N4V1I5_ENTVE